MFKITCSVSEAGNLEIFHEKETNALEVMIVSPESIFDNIDIQRRVVDGATTIAMYAQITPEEIAILLQNVLDYSEQKLLQYIMSGREV